MCNWNQFRDLLYLQNMKEDWPSKEESWQIFKSKPETGSNPDVPQLKNGYRKCDSFTQWNTIQLLKTKALWILQANAWNLRISSWVRQEPSIFVSREALSSSRWRQMQRYTARHQEKLQVPCGRVGDRNDQAREIKNTQRKPTESTNMGPREITETELLTKEQTEAGSKTPTHLE